MPLTYNQILSAIKAYCNTEEDIWDEVGKGADTEERRQYCQGAAHEAHDIKMYLLSLWDKE